MVTVSVLSASTVVGADLTVNCVTGDLKIIVLSAFSEPQVARTTTVLAEAALT
jgi:hypothetical protein